MVNVDVSAVKRKNLRIAIAHLLKLCPFTGSLFKNLTISQESLVLIYCLVILKVLDTNLSSGFRTVGQWMMIPTVMKIQNTLEGKAM